MAFENVMIEGKQNVIKESQKTRKKNYIVTFETSSRALIFQNWSVHYSRVSKPRLSFEPYKAFTDL